MKYLLLLCFFDFFVVLPAQNCNDFLDKTMWLDKDEFVPSLISKEVIKFESDFYEVGFSFLKPKNNFKIIMVFLAVKDFKDDIFGNTTCEFFFENTTQSFKLRHTDYLSKIISPKSKNFFTSFIDNETDEKMKVFFGNLKSKNISKIIIDTPLYNIYTIPFYQNQKKQKQSLQDLANCIEKTEL